MTKKILAAMLAVLLCLGLALSAFAVEYEDPERVRSLKMNVSTATVTIGGTRQLRATVSPRTATETLSWSSADPDIASVDNNGLVQAHKAGITSITVESERGIKAYCRVTVRDPDAKVYVRSVELSSNSMTIRVNQTRQLISYVLPSNVSSADKEITWSTADPDIAEVDVEGTVTGVAPGTTVITAEVTDGKSARCTVTVSDKVVSGITEDTVNTQLPDSGEVLTSAAVKTVVENAVKSLPKNRVGIASFKDKSTISPAVLRAAAYTAESAGRSVLLRFSTTGENGKANGYLAIDPQKAKDITSDIKLGVWTDSKQANAIRAMFEKHYKNKLAVIHCAQPGSFGMAVTLYAQIAPYGMDSGNLRFYSYDPDTNRFRALEGSGYSGYGVDQNGYLHFGTATGGIIIVSDGVLAS